MDRFNQRYVRLDNGIPDVTKKGLVVYMSILLVGRKLHLLQL